MVQHIITTSSSMLRNNSTILQLLAITRSVATRGNIFKTFAMKKNHEIAKIPSNIYVFKSNELADKYRVEIGLRTAVILGSMVIFIVFYFLWHNISKLLLKNFRNIPQNRKKDYNLDYWLDYVDRMKHKRKRSPSKSIIIIYSPKLPDIPYDPRISTRDWVKRHRDMMQISMPNESNWYNETVLLNNDFDFNKDVIYNETLNDKQKNDKNQSFTKIKDLFNKITNKKKSRTVRKSIFYKELEANAQLIENYYKDILHNVPPLFSEFKVKRRSHSWPKCNKDYLKMHSLNFSIKS